MGWVERHLLVATDCVDEARADRERRATLERERSS